MRVGRYAKKHQMPQRMGKTLRIVRYKRLVLPHSNAQLTETVPPDAVALSTENVDVTVEQWGIVVLLSDVAQITTTHPALQIAIDRTGLAIAEVLEREQCNTLLAGTQVFYPAAVASRAALNAEKLDTATVLKTTVSLRNLGAAESDGGLFNGVISPQQEGDILGADQTFKDASNFANVRKLEFGEIGIWMGVRWGRGNFLPIFKGQGTPIAGTSPTGTLDAGTAVPHVEAVDGGGSIASATNFKFAVVFRDKTTDYERHITQTSANIASAATGNNESFVIRVPTGTLTNYVYDVYMTIAGGTGSLFKVASRQSAASTTITAVPAGTEATLPAAPAATKEVFVAWVFGQDSFGRVELDGMSLASYLTPAGASYSNPLAQGRKVGTKIMWKSFIIDNNFFARIETTSAYSAGLPTG
jgi:N4-gp56 family major capsid protein